MSEKLQSWYQRRPAFLQLMLFFLLYFFAGLLIIWLFEFFLLDTTRPLEYYVFEAAAQSLLLTIIFKWNTIKTMAGKREHQRE